MLSVSEARTQRKVLMKRSEELIKIGDEMAARLIELQDAARNRRDKKSAQKVHRAEVNKFRLLVDLLEKDLEEFQIGDPQNYRQHYNPLVPYMKLVGGALGALLTLVWLVHIVIFMLFSPPLHPFLNTYLGFFDGFFPLFGTLTIGILALYLLLAASAGAAKFGTRFFLISVHALEPHKTLLNSFMFNVQLVLLCVLPTVQFCTDAFSQYARNTDAGVSEMGREGREGRRGIEIDDSLTSSFSPAHSAGYFREPVQVHLRLPLLLAVQCLPLHDCALQLAARFCNHRNFLRNSSLPFRSPLNSSASRSCPASTLRSSPRTATTSTRSWPRSRRTSRSR